MIDLVLPATKKVLTQGNYGSYEIGPVLAHVSRSLASSLRRVLLSSLPGAAITSIRIEGVQHEFQAIENVKEDVTDIVQNLKQIRLICFSERSVLMHLEALGEGIVRARDIHAPGTIEIINPDASIATLDNENAHLSMEMTVRVGRGFVPFDEQDARELPIGIIPIDAIYSPIRHVHFTIEPVRGGYIDALDTIVLSITTDGTISPDEALRQGAEILRQQFAVFASGRYERDVADKPTIASSVLIPQQIYDLSIDDLNIPTRAVNSFKRYGIACVGQILEMDGKTLLAMRNVGEKALQEIARALKMRNVFPKL